MKQEYISKVWLLQNIVADEDSDDMHTIEAAPVVEFDSDELHQLRRITGRLRRGLEELMDAER